MQHKALKLLALAPIPIVVALVAWASSRPLPPLPPIKKGPAVPAQLILPPTLGGGWQIDGEQETFGKKSLFDRINGAAPAYIEAGYRYSVGADYRKEGLADPVTVDVYDMGKAEQAAAIFAKERAPDTASAEIGDDSYLGGGSLNFCHKGYYVKLAGFEQSPEVDAALKDLAAALVALLK